MNPKKYPDGFGDYIRSLQPGMNWKECYEKTMEHFGLDREYIGFECFKAYAKRHRVTNGLDGRFKKGNAPFSKGKRMPPEVYEKCKKTMFKKGNLPANTAPVGVRTRDREGYWKQKVSDDRTVPSRSNWKFVHDLVWEGANGPIPDGCIVTFLDGDKDNLALSNLALVSRAENQFLNAKKLRSGSKEVTKAGISVARLHCAVREKANADKD